MSSKIHLITYANNLPFTQTQQMLNDSITNFTSYEVIKHTYDLNTISKLDWFPKVNELLKYQVSEYKKKINDINNTYSTQIKELGSKISELVIKFKSR
jgi:hypothetical protein